VLAALGIPAPAGFEGEDLLAPRDPGHERPALSQFDIARDSRYSLRTADWKITLARSRELYDLRSDPGERHDLWRAEPARAAEMQRTAAALLAAREHPPEVKAPVRPDLEKRLRALGYVE
jgi:hypothetical protein